jgi:hypothetical protein
MQPPVSPKAIHIKALRAYAFSAANTLGDGCEASAGESGGDRIPRLTEVIR